MKKMTDYPCFETVLTMFICVVLSATAWADDKYEVPEYARVYSTEASFEDTKDDLLEAISGRGLVISYTSHVKSMLDNTASVTKTREPIYANAEILLFCKADLSHDLIQNNPHNIVLCPYTISIYVLTHEPERVYLSYRRLESEESKTEPIEALLSSIIEEVIENE